MPCPVEEIPPGDRLFRRITRGGCDSRNGDCLQPTAFLDGGSGKLSVNWEKHADAEATRQQARSPERFGVAALSVGLVRGLGLKVVHDPTDDNCSHTHIEGVTPAMSMELARIGILLIPPPPKPTPR